MAIDLPPVIPPELTDLELYAGTEVQELPAIRELVNNIPVKVIGNTYLPEQMIKEVLLTAEKPSEALANLTRLFYNQGHLLVKLNYQRVGDEVVISVEQLRLNDIKGDEHIVRHFDSLKGDEDLKADEFYRASAIARTSASRAGLAYSISYDDMDDEEGVTLVFNGKQNTYRKNTTVTSDVSNRGSRYLGRYFSGINVTHNTETGTAIRANYSRAIPELGDSRDGKSLAQTSLSVSVPTLYGLYGVQASYLQYEREIPTLNPLGSSSGSTANDSTDINATTFRFALTGEQIVLSKQGKRFSITEKLEHVSSVSAREGWGQDILRENYQVGELGFKYSQNNYEDSNAKPYLLAANLTIRAGIGGGDGTLDQYSEFANAFSARYPDRPVPEVLPLARSSEFVALKAGLNFRKKVSDKWIFGATSRLQWSDKQLPQQQQFVLGGMYSMSAYLGGALVGDEGIYAKAQFETAKRIGAFTVRPVIFAEAGASRYNQTSGQNEDVQSLADAGVRLRLAYGDKLSSEISVVRPLHEKVVNEARLDEMRVNFYWHLQYKFL